MSRWRSKKSSGPIRVASKPAVVRLDDRIVPDTTGVPTDNPAPVDPTTPSTTTTPADPTDPAPTDTPPTGSDTTTTGSDTTTTTTPPTTPPPPPPQIYSVGAEAGNPAQVIVFDNTGEKRFDFVAYPSFRGGVHTAVGDVTGDGVADIVTAPGPGIKGTVKIFDGSSGQRMLVFDAYDATFRGGVNLAVADMNGDGRADIITGAGEGGGSHVKIFNGLSLFPTDPYQALQVNPGPNAYLIREFFAYDAQYLVGARVAVADINNDGRNDIVTAPGQNGGPHIRVFSGVDGTVFREWFAYDARFNGGVFVAAADLNNDSYAEVITGMGLGGVGEVKVFEGRFNFLIRSFTAENFSFRVSSRVGVIDFDADGDRDIMIANMNAINAFDGRTFTRVGEQTPFDPSHVGGMFFG